MPATTSTKTTMSTAPRHQAWSSSSSSSSSGWMLRGFVALAIFFLCAFQYHQAMVTTTVLLDEDPNHYHYYHYSPSISSSHQGLTFTSQKKASDNNNNNNDDDNAAPTSGNDGGTPAGQISVQQQQQQQPPPVQFIRHHHVKGGTLTENDIFAAAWWQSIERFQQFNPHTIGIVEDNVFSPVKRTAGGYQDVRMTVDWLDFSLEHLSRYWKLASETIAGTSYIMGMLQASTASTCQRFIVQSQQQQNQYQQQQQPRGLMSSTLVLIPLGLGGNPAPLDLKLWQLAIQGTMAALLKHHPRRMVLVGYYDNDAVNARAAFAYLQAHCRVSSTGNNGTTTLNDNDGVDDRDNDSSSFFETPLSPHTTLAYVRAYSNVTTKYIKQNIPKAALHDLHLAITNGQSADILPRDKDPQFLTKLRRQYLAIKERDHDSSNAIKYIYMTESDQILHARPTPQFLNLLDQGSIIIPYRLQPIPHALDLQDIIPTKYLPANQFPPKQVVDLHYETDSCCDTAQHLFIGRNDPKKPACGDVWWRCGFGRRSNFDHFQDYQFMRLSQGTNLVSLAATEWSRRCIPRPNQRGCGGAGANVNNEEEEDVEI